MEELPKCKYCNYSNSNSIELNNHHLTCYKKYINEILLKNSQIDNFVKSVKKRLLDTLTKLDEDFEQIVNNILDDYVALHHKLELIKIDRFSKNGTVGTMNRLNKWIENINNNESFTQKQLNEIKDLFFLVDNNFNKIDEITNNPKYDENQIKEIFELAEQMLNGEIIINDELKIKEEMLIKDGMLKKTDKQEYKFDKISIIKNLKKQIENFDIKNNPRVTYGNLKTHTINAIIFAYKDYYNVGLVPKGAEKENGFINKEIASNPFFKLVNNLKLNRSNKVKFSNDIHGNKISKKDFKYFENYLLFDSMSILYYSKVSFLGRKLYIFYEDASRQSGEFKKLKEDLEVTKELIKTNI